MSEEKIPIPQLPQDEKVKLNKSLTFWSSILIVLDKKLQSLEENYGFGEIGLTIVVHRGEMAKIIWQDKIFDNELVKKGGGKNYIADRDMKEDKEALERNRK